MDARNIRSRGQGVRGQPSRGYSGTGRRKNAGRYDGGRNNSRWTPQIDEKGPKPPQELLTMEYFENLFKEMLQKDDPEGISEAILAQRNLVTNMLNEDLTKKVELSRIILKVIVKASYNMKLSKSFRILLTLVLESHFAKRTIDTLVSVYLPSSRDIGIFADIVSFFKLALELFPGLAYDMFYYRVGNLKMLLGIPYFQTEMSDELTQELDELTIMLASSDPNKKAKEAIFQEPNIETMESEDSLDDFRAKNIFPTTAELLYEKKDIFLRENRSRGAYTSVNEYLDVQFRLMHEDFIQPLREGLREYKDDPSKKNMNIRVYKKVLSLKSHLNPRLGIIHYIQLDQERLRRIKWSQSKRLLYGSLLCFSSDNFETLLFATVANRDDKDIKEGILAVKFMGKSLSEDEEYTLVESMNMFESYKYVLAKLQATNEGNLPMKKYLVFAERDISPPHYLSRNTCYYLSKCLFRPDPRSALRWPLPAELQMNKSQFLAFKNALTKELTIIQGPPGTGKTYLGLKICACLVQNVKNSSNFGPILVVCYTNHALDQFLEGILTFTDSVVRVGGQSKSQVLKEYCLNELKNKEPYNRYKGKKRDIYENLEYLEQCCNEYSNRFSTIINLRSLTPYMSWHHCRFFDNISIESWLSGKDYSIFSSTSSVLVEDEVERIMYELIEVTLQEIVLENDQPDPFWERGDEACDENDSDTEVNYIQGQRILDVDKDDIGKLTSSFRDVMSLPFVKTRLAKRQGRKVKNRLQKTSLVNIKSMTAEDVNAETDLDGLSLQGRWRMYKYWRHLYVEQSMMRLQRYELEYEHLSKYLNEVSLDEDKWIMMSKDVIGMTTTGAARYRRVLEKIACKIIIVEEAAEVLESHIIGSLNPGCQHLVLMGDHKQLRPSPAVYQLATKYHLDLSLFERMINNKLDFNSLSVQHRMRPEIADIVRFIYEDLEDSYSVSQYPNVPAMRNNLFFFNHASQEHLNQDIQSYSNRFEAEIIVKLCYHMLQNGIQGAKITILTLYSGQLFLLKSLMNKNLFPEVRVCVVDNFQGEENDIILLSLVRSNEEQKIGFVGIDNRICVSLSRAKHGLYVFGDFDLMASRNKLWKKICQSAKKERIFGRRP